MSVIEPRPNPETVEALLDTTWRVAQTETARTDALDRKAATAASFASVLATLTATLGIRSWNESGRGGRSLSSCSACSPFSARSGWQ